MIKNKNKIISLGLALLGVAMIVIGIQGGVLPPTLTGVGFLLLTWHLI